jgi:5-methylcytosine-specific restriction protein A
MPVWRNDRTSEALRRHHLAAEPLCRMCAAHGVVTSATVVDHIETTAANPDRRLDPTNLQSLCAGRRNGPK